MRPGRPIGGTPALTLAIANSAVPRKPAGARERSIDDPFRDRPSLVRFVANRLPTERDAISQNDLARLTRWRDALFELLTGYAGGKVSPTALAIINKEVQRAASIRHISADLAVEVVVCGGLVKQVIAACLDELAACDPTRLKRCLRPECGLLFYDTTRNRSARWHAENPCGWRSRGDRRGQLQPP